MSTQEFEREPVRPEKLQPARNFAASYAGEHVAGTEFVIGAMFVTWGVGTGDILTGLLLGNLLAVLSWALICAPIAADTRLTLYAYLEKIGGPGTVKIYSVVNGILFCILAGAMITVSASAVRILFDLPSQVHWYPTSVGFVLVALLVGIVVVAIAMRGFRRVAQFAEVCAPWMILMFLAGSLSMLPVLVGATPGISSIENFSQFKAIADTYIWVEGESEMGMWHVAAFAWICNLSMHGGLSDMTVLRFARKKQYGYFSAFGMFVGHFLAWIWAGIMGAGAALLMKTTVTELDPGAVAFQALGAAGILAVIIAGWTTSNPTIYRAGLAFQSINPSWNRTKVTAVVGAVTTAIACFPFVFSKLMDFVGLMGLLLSPVGAIIVTEHWVFPKIGKTRYWAHYKKLTTNIAAIFTWMSALLIAFVLNQLGLHLFFLLIPTWISAMLIYTVMASRMGAAGDYREQAAIDTAAEEKRKNEEKRYLQELADSKFKGHGNIQPSIFMNMWGALSLVSLGACLLLAVLAYVGIITLDEFRNVLIWPTLLYFVSATRWVIYRESTQESHSSVNVAGDTPDLA
ncbi:cytosine permease [Microbulbifer sp. SH-1]|uniref:purine-cytosine permease family protein n=1 Tax=Microbulbifer sp. SH-1 TaxID=2681547 RepID=UPI00197B87E7|nr:hypothetical protein [Microbulbifer sp. SH-1]